MTDKMREEFEAWYEGVTGLPVEFNDVGIPVSIGVLLPYLYLPLGLLRINPSPPTTCSISSKYSIRSCYRDWET